MAVISDDYTDVIMAQKVIVGVRRNGKVAYDDIKLKSVQGVQYFAKKRIKYVVMVTINTGATDSTPTFIRTCHRSYERAVKRFNQAVKYSQKSIQHMHND